MSSGAKESTQNSLNPLTQCSLAHAAWGAAPLTELGMMPNPIASFLFGRRGCCSVTFYMFGTPSLRDEVRIRGSGKAGGTLEPFKVTEDLQL